jgi:hypothetical protein
MDDPTIVRTFSDRGEAEIARSLLEAEGIGAAIAADDTRGNWPQFDLSAGVQLVVEAGDVERARELLDEVVSEDDLDAAELESEDPIG